LKKKNVDMHGPGHMLLFFRPNGQMYEKKNIFFTSHFFSPESVVVTSESNDSNMHYTDWMLYDPMTKGVVLSEDSRQTKGGHYEDGTVLMIFMVHKSQL
jgi:hypothetical protein